jgi:hypothetical protein
MGHPDCECPVLVFRYSRRGRRACEYQHIFLVVSSNLISTFQAFPPANIIFTGIGVLLLVRVFRDALER